MPGTGPLPPSILEVRGEGYDDMPEYIKVEIRL